MGIQGAVGLKGQENQSRSKTDTRVFRRESLQTRQVTTGGQGSHWSYTFSGLLKVTTASDAVKGESLVCERNACAAEGDSYEIAVKMGHLFRKTGEMRRSARISLATARRKAYDWDTSIYAG